MDVCRVRECWHALCDSCSARHWRQTRQFLYRHGAGQELAGQLTVTEEELTQFKARVGVALDKMAATREQERERVCNKLGFSLDKWGLLHYMVSLVIVSS